LVCPLNVLVILAMTVIVEEEPARG
jgi:hypothetical protein